MTGEGPPPPAPKNRPPDGSAWAGLPAFVSGHELADLGALEQFFAEGIPFNKFLGLRLTGLGRGWASAELPFRPELIGDPSRPALHGGVISMMADTLGGGAVFTLVDPGDKVATIDLRVDYLRPGRPEDLLATAWVIRLGNRVGVASIELSHPSQPDQLVALGKGVYVIKRSVE